MFSFNHSLDYSQNTFSENVNQSKHDEKLLNLKICYLNSSSSKFVGIGISFTDLSPKVRIGGQNGFHVDITEEEWKKLLQYQGVIANYFYSLNVECNPLNIGEVTISFEKINQVLVIKINKHGNYVYLACNTVDKLWEAKDLVDYRIQMLKRQEFDKYFHLFQSNSNCQLTDPLSTAYNYLKTNQTPNSENVSTLMEMLLMYPRELESKIKKCGIKRKYQNISE